MKNKFIYQFYFRLLCLFLAIISCDQPQKKLKVNQKNIESKTLVKYVAIKIIRLPLYINEKEIEQTNFKSIPLIIYTLAKSMTNIMFIYIIIIFIKNIFAKALNFNFNFAFFWCTLSDNIYNLLLVFILARFTLKFSKTLIKTIKSYL